MPYILRGKARHVREPWPQACGSSAVPAASAVPRRRSNLNFLVIHFLGATPFEVVQALEVGSSVPGTRGIFGSLRYATPNSKHHLFEHDSPCLALTMSPFNLDFDRCHDSSMARIRSRIHSDRAPVPFGRKSLRRASGSLSFRSAQSWRRTEPSYTSPTPASSVPVREHSRGGGDLESGKQDLPVDRNRSIRDRSKRDLPEDRPAALEHSTSRSSLERTRASRGYKQTSWSSGGTRSSSDLPWTAATSTIPLLRRSSHDVPAATPHAPRLYKHKSHAAIVSETAAAHQGRFMAAPFGGPTGDSRRGVASPRPKGRGMAVSRSAVLLLI